jgi:broad specificity phosphatase PhoE
MAALVHLVRHTTYALLDRALGGRERHSLSAEGRADAERVAAWLEDSHAAAVVSSPVQRARETAEAIARRLGLVVRLDPSFAEIDVASWSGRRFEELQGDAAWKAWNAFRSTVGIPGGETMLAVQARAIAGVMRYATESDEAEFVVVSHADVIKAVLAHFLGAPLDLLRRIEISPGSISQIMLYPEDARILAVNVRP